METTLSDDQILKIVENKTNSNLIVKGQHYESRLCIYTEPLWREQLLSEYGYQQLENTLQKQINNTDKAGRTMEFMSYPFPIVDHTKDISNDLYKVFNARNPAFYNTFATPQQEVAASAVLGELDIRGFIEKEGKAVLLNKPNTFVVVDKDEDGNVFIFTVVNERVNSITYDHARNIETFSFLDKTYTENGETIKRYCYYDKSTYCVVLEVNGNYRVDVRNPHLLGYCPVAPFIAANLNNKDKFNKWNAFAPSLAVLEKWTLYNTYCNYAEMYGVFPIIQVPKQACSVSECNSGYITHVGASGEDFKTKCQSCANSTITGAGTVYEIDVAMDKDEVDARGVVSFTSPPTENLEFELGLQDRRLAAIKKAITGVNDVLEKEAVNETQVRGLMEDRRKPLLFIAEQLQVLHKWIAKTAVYLQNAITFEPYVNYGTEWYLMTEQDLQLLYKNAKAEGMPENELSDLYDLLIETKYKSDPRKTERIKILTNLNPAPFNTMDEVYAKMDKGLFGGIDAMIKANFEKYINRFERENIDIVTFGSDAIEQGTMSFNSKIDKIYGTLKKYAEDEKSENDTTQPIDEQGSSSVARTGIPNSNGNPSNE